MANKLAVRYCRCSRDYLKLDCQVALECELGVVEQNAFPSDPADVFAFPPVPIVPFMDFDRIGRLETRLSRDFLFTSWNVEYEGDASYSVTYLGSYLRHCGSNCASGLVLVSTLAGLVENPPQPDLEAIGVPPQVGNVRADDYHDLFVCIDWTASVMTAAPTPDHVLDQKKLSMAMTPPYVRRAMVGKRLDNGDIAQQIDIPVLLIHGGKDATIPRYKIDELRRLLPNSRAITYDCSGHSPFEEEPVRFNSDLMDYVKARGSTDQKAL